MIAALALAALLVSAEPRPGYELVPPRELWEAAVRYDSRANTLKIQVDACEQKLATRTSTVIERLVPMASPPPEPSWTLPAALGAAGVAVGLVVGVLLAR